VKRNGKRPAKRSTRQPANSEAIVEALRAKSPQAPGALAKVLKLQRAALTYQIRPLLQSGTVMASGHTGNRQFSLPPRSKAAKEAP